MTASTERVRAEALDRADPLRPFRDRFVLADADLIYLNGNSLGRLPLATAERLNQVVKDEWGTELTGAWERWIDLPEAVGDRLGRAALGAGPGQVLVADSTTVNLYKLVRAALEVLNRRAVLVVDAAEFPTDRYVVDGIAAETDVAVRRMRSDEVCGPTVDDVLRVTEREPAVVVLSHVHFRSGAVADVGAITEAVHDDGGAVVWDLSHSAGVVPVDLDSTGVALAVGCTYKYLNAGPGSPAFLYVRRDLQAGMRQPIWGWFGQREQFAMGARYEPRPDIGRFLTGTPSPLLLHAVDEGVALVEEAGIDRLATKAGALTALAIDLAQQWLVPLGFELVTPTTPERRGAHIALRHDAGWPVTCALIEQARVVPDFRPPDVVRFGFPPLYTRFVDVWDAFDRVRQAVADGVHMRVVLPDRRVT